MITLATQAEIEKAPHVCSDKVNEIRRRIEEGTYWVSADVLARELIAASSFLASNLDLR